MRRKKQLEAVRAPAPELLHSQALLVTAGPFRGRICENDDDAFIYVDDLHPSDLRWIKAAGATWRIPELEPDDAEDAGEWVDKPGIDCEIVTFGYYLHCGRPYDIPRQFLRPATMKDLVQRHQEISDIVFGAAWGKGVSFQKLTELLIEKSYITDEIWRRESAAKSPAEARNVFLCHASADKPFVRQVHYDLANAGHSAWIDEFEIKVGDSIVGKINEATERADALILFVSEQAMTSEWVKREWNSALARMLAGNSIRVLPALIEDCATPALIADIKYADFRESYNSGLNELLVALASLDGQVRKN